MPDSELPLSCAPVHRRWTLAGQFAAVSGPDTTVATVAEASAGLELFATPAATPEEGYAKWKAEAAAARAHDAAARRAQELPVQADAAGYAGWKAEMEAARRAFEQHWGVPLGKPVRVLLRGEGREREGPLRLADEVTEQRNGPPPRLMLRLGQVVFDAARIERVVRMD